MVSAAEFTFYLFIHFYMHAPSPFIFNRLYYVHLEAPIASLLAACFLVKRGTVLSVRATPALFSKQWNSTWQLLAR